MGGCTQRQRADITWQVSTGDEEVQLPNRLLDLEILLLCRILHQLPVVDLARLASVHSRFQRADASHPQHLSVVEEVARDRSMKILQDLYPGTQLPDIVDKQLSASRAPVSRHEKVHAAGDRAPSWQASRCRKGSDGQPHSWQLVLRYLERRQLAVRWQGKVAVGGDHNREAVLLVRDGRLLSFRDPADDRTVEILPGPVKETGVPGIGICEGVDKVSQVSAGLWDGLVVRESGELWSWGKNREGQGGQAAGEVSTEPQAAEALRGRQVAHAEVTSRHAILLGREGEVFCLGSNCEGQLGQRGRSGQASGADGPPASPVPVSLPARARQVSCGLAHSSAVTVGGQLYTWGGLEGFISQQPRRVGGAALDAHFVVHAAGGYGHTAVLTAGGALVGVGRNYDGQLGLDYSTMSEVGRARGVWPAVEVPVRARASRCGDGACVTGGARRVVDVAAGSTSTAVITEDGHLLVTRRDKFGFDCLGRGFVAVACGWGKGILGLKEDGSLEALAGLENVPLPSKLAV